MKYLPILAVGLLVGLVGGCGPSSLGDHESQIVLVTGAGGAGVYGPLERGLRDGGVTAPLDTFHWGAPLPLFMINLQDRSIHASAEDDLAKSIVGWRGRHPDGRLVIIGHSAGCGVTLGALGKLEDSTAVDQVLLLAPSVSPGYDLAPPLRHVRQRLDVFYSDQDIAALKWRTGTFGTYDNVRTPAAGHLGFSGVDQLPQELREKVVQHPYDPAWADLGNDGGHVGTLPRRFSAAVLAPILGGNTQSSAASSH